MSFRIRYFRDDVLLGDIASDKTLAETREEAAEQIIFFAAEYAIITDLTGRPIERVLSEA